ncbi:MAG TPA: DinB family protein [Candidatus Sulfotelmatobacter sp.]|nr:DinB family protein [Candidatus Sulfotelmatobacter sp.]
MNRRSRLVLLVLLAASLASAAGPRSHADEAVDHTAPSYDMKAQALVDLEAMQKKFVDLANALPADKLTWRPSPDSRSFAEVFLHVAAERYGILGMMGAETPAGVDKKALEKSATDRARIVDELNKSWDFAQKTIKGMTNAEFAKLLPKLGPQANAGDVVYILVADNHEHLGQSIAYARENGIIPPWTIAAQKAAAEKKAQQK